MALCFFCGADESLTRAHLFQSRFRDSIKEVKIPVSLAASSSKAPGEYRDVVYDGDIRKSHVTSLCKDCNNNWMNSIEVAAAPVFESIMGNKGFPVISDLFKLAHWASLVGALSSELFPYLEIPVEHRRAIRDAKTGQAKGHSTYFIWTADYIESIQMDLYRGVVRDDNGVDSVSWFSVLHSGPLVVITVSELLGPRTARVLSEHEIESVLGAFSSNILYVSRGLEEAARGGKGRPIHEDVVKAVRLVAGADLKFVKTRGSELADLSRGVEIVKADLTFDFGDSLRDVSDSLDLRYLREVFI